MDFANIISAAGNEFAQNASEMEETQSYIDTGSYTLNAVLSGSIYKGLPGNKVTAYAGEQATGKTFFVFEAVKNFLLSKPEGRVLFFETENALEKGMFDSQVSGYEEYISGTYDQVFLNSENKTWSPKDGRFTFTNAWTVGGCS